MRSASELNTALLDAAAQQKDLSSKDAQQAQVDFIAQIDPEQRGKFDGGVGGQDALKASAGARELDAAAPVNKFGQPLVLMEGPTSINWATPASTALFAGGQLQWTTQADLHMAAAHTVASVSANATGLFTHDGGIQAVAANGPVSLQAHTDQLEILADKAVTIVSVNDVIEIKANKKIVLQAGKSSVTLEDGNIKFSCPGSFSVKGAQHIFCGGTRSNVDIGSLPSDVSTPPPTLGIPKVFSQKFDIGAMVHNDPELIGATYEIWTTTIPQKILRSGTIDSYYQTVRIFTESPQDLELIIGENEWFSYHHIAEEERDD